MMDDLPSPVPPTKATLTLPMSKPRASIFSMAWVLSSGAEACFHALGLSSSSILPWYLATLSAWACSICAMRCVQRPTGERPAPQPEGET
jgi:hypothetical protein